jgi:pseudouridine-5'-phosphate glycosidase
MTMRVAPTIAAALAAGAPVVALESTLVTHGLPPPMNAAAALAAEAAVRAAGAVPATIGLLAGVPTVGLTPAEIHHLASAGSGILKASRRDLAWAAVRRLDAGTTVAATLALAQAAGIRVFATGGIGGVHRGAAKTFDISADLWELSRTPMAVVCAGAKIILDLPKTLELLESLGVPVVGFGCRELPGFYLRSTGLPLEQYVDTADEAAELALAHWHLGGSGLLFVQPPPRDLGWSLERADVEITNLLAEANQTGQMGKQLTPFLLRRLGELTTGATLTINEELLIANAATAAALACSLARGRS